MRDGSTPANLRDLTLETLIERLSSAEPVPGGGSAAAMVASMGAALVAMVAALSEGRPKYADHAELLTATRAEALRMRDRFLDLAEEDAAAYGGFAAALKLPKETPDDRAARTKATRASARKSAEVPLACLEACVELISLAEGLVGRSNVNASSDLSVATLLGEAAGRSAAANVLENLPSAGDAEFTKETTGRTVDLLERITRVGAKTREAVLRREARPPLASVRG